MTRLTVCGTMAIESAWMILGRDATPEGIAAELRWSVASVRRYILTLEATR